MILGNCDSTTSLPQPQSRKESTTTFEDKTSGKELERCLEGRWWVAVAGCFEMSVGRWVIGGDSIKLCCSSLSKCFHVCLDG